MQNDRSGTGSHSLQFREWANSLPSSSSNQMGQTRISFFSENLHSFVHIDDINGLLLHRTSFHNPFDTVSSEGVWWLNVLNPTEEEIDILSEAFSFHPLTTEDLKTRKAVEKVESFKQYYFCSIRSFRRDDKDGGNHLELTNLYVIVFGEGVLSFAFGKSEHAANVQKRIAKLGTIAGLRGNWICYALVDDIVDGLGQLIRQIEQETSAIEDSTFTSLADDSDPLLRQIYRCRMNNMAALGLLRNKACLIKSLARRCDNQNDTVSHGEINLYLSHIQDHIATMISDLGHFENMLSRSHRNYLVRFSVDGIERRNRTISVLKRMAIIGGMVLVLNIVCRLLGINVPVLNGDTSSLCCWFGIFGVIAISFVILIVTMRRFG